MSYFTSDFNQFFIELAANNNKDWFDENRKRYEQNVKKPFEIFVRDLAEELVKVDSDMEVEPKKAIFRINRDIRFSKDKTPYKLNRSAALSKMGKKDGGYPGFYIQMGPENVAIAGGAYQPSKEQLNAIRLAIGAEPKKFRNAIEQPDFISVYGTLKGAENKRLPSKELTEAAEVEPLIFKKQFYYWTEYDAAMVTDPKLIPFLVEKHQAAKEIRDFIKAALK